jgi:hypothetical protein
VAAAAVAAAYDAIKTAIIVVGAIKIIVAAAVLVVLKPCGQSKCK